MKTSWQIGRIAGIGIHVHITFPLLLLAIAALDIQADATLLELAVDLAFIAILFTIVVLHELGHALTARRFGTRTDEIMLLPIGGIARLERMPEKPLEELAVALAGPAVNAAIAAVLFGAVFAIPPKMASWGEIAMLRDDFVVRLAWVNIAMAAFNLVPAFPMDGGRVLRALLALRMNHARATTIAANIGKGFAVAMGAFGIFANPLLVLIGVFVWMGADAEAKEVQMRSSLARVKVEDVCVREFRSLLSHLTLTDAVAQVLPTYQHTFPVWEDRHVVGMLTRGQLLSALATHGGSTPISEIMLREFPAIEAGDTIGQLLRRVHEGNGSALAVMRPGELVGLVDEDNVAEYFAFQSALHPRRSAHHPEHPVMGGTRAA